MMGIQVPDALLKATDVKNLTNMGAAEAAATIAETV